MPGIYDTWEECKKQVEGFSGSTYKSFSTLKEAETFLGFVNEKVMSNETITNTDTNTAIAYVDGSYDSDTNLFSCGVVFFHLGLEQHFFEAYPESDLSDMNNVAGEIKGSEKAIQYCIDNGIKSIIIYHDYEGISKWCTGEWQAKKDGTKAYKSFYDEASKRVNISFVKVKGHSGDKYNDLADQLAKRALINNSKPIKNKGDSILAKSKGVFIDRNKIKGMIDKIGSDKWTSFSASELVQVGNTYRCDIVAEGKEAKLNLYFNNNGSTTITPTGSNPDISGYIKALLEDKYAFATNVEGKTYSFKKLPSEWANKLVEYLSGIDDVKCEQEDITSTPIHKMYRFTSNLGDILTVNIYDTGTLTLQGKPAYLYGEAISLLSYCPDISVDDIVDTINSFHSIDIKTSDVRDELKVLLPQAYSHLDDMILKMLSPSISLRKVKMEMEDYSCYAFSALRALEGYIKDLFRLKGVTVGNNFGGIFDHGALTTPISSKIGNATYQVQLECLYDYLVKNRHVVFHTQQVLIGTTLLEDKAEADEIVNSILTLIETSYIAINP